jgi:hypothetical protein
MSLDDTMILSSSAALLLSSSSSVAAAGDMKPTAMNVAPATLHHHPMVMSNLMLTPICSPVLKSADPSLLMHGALH